MTKIVSISTKEARQLADRALFGEIAKSSEADKALLQADKALLEGEFGPKVKHVELADGTITDRTVEVFEKPCPPAMIGELERALGRRAMRDIRMATIDHWLETVAGFDLRKERNWITREGFLALLQNPYSETNDTRLQRIINEEAARFQSLGPAAAFGLSTIKKYDYQDEIKKKHRLSGAEAKAVTKVIWDNEGKSGRPPNDPHNKKG